MCFQVLHRDELLSFLENACYTVFEYVKIVYLLHFNPRNHFIYVISLKKCKKIFVI